MIAAVHLSPAWTTPVAAVAAIAILAYWWRLGRSGVPGGRRRIRRMSMLVMFVALPMLLAGLSFLDPDTDGRRYVIVWSGATFLMLLLFLTACLDGLYSLGAYRVRLEEEIRDAGADLRTVLAHGRGAVEAPPRGPAKDDAGDARGESAP